MNRNNAAVKRIMQEARELANDPSTDYSAAPLEDDIFEWHCTIRGPQGTEFEGGLYHVRILLPAEYPFKAPSLMVLTPNGRFELNTKICISFTSYHEELWQPAWGVRTGLQGFFPLKGQAAVGVGSIEFPTSERKRLAALSRSWTCPHCQQTNLELLADPVASENPTPPVEIQEAQSSPENVKSDAVPADSTNTPTPAPAETATAPPAQSDHTPSEQPADPSSSPSPPALAVPHTSSRVPDGTSPSPPVGPVLHGPQVVVRASSNKPPLLLDTAICVILVLVFALICRRMF
ncbi:hypothetical protein V5O48_011374 [Marasmius crinis-equi]|uniref:UBC core domain-containing protein n=1 Tax=Marasmius crinis-equi TaxID=585013 RepID=A0ABR3F652_9AGAR